MSQQAYTSLLKEIEKGQFAPVYWLEGEESFFIDRITEALRRHVIPEEAKDFNQWIIYGKEVSINELLSCAKQYPMGFDKRLIIVKQAQQMLSWKEKEKIQLFSDYLSQPAPFTVLVVCVNLAPRSSFLSHQALRKQLKKHALCFESKKIYDNQLPDWIQSYVQSASHQLTHKAVALICESVGNDLQRIAHELDKLMINCSTEAPITEQQIEQYIGISKDFNMFELQKALSSKKKKKAYQIIDYLTTSAQMPSVLMLGMLFQYFLRVAKYHALSRKYTGAHLAKQIGVHPYFLQEYKASVQYYPLEKVWKNIHLIQDTDLRIKGIHGYTTKESELFKELIYGLLH